MRTAETLDDLVELAWEAAAGVPELGALEQVRVAPYIDSDDKEAFLFSFLVDRGRDPGQIGVTRIQLGMKVRDALLARGDERYPYVQVLNRAERETVLGARSR